MKAFLIGVTGDAALQGLNKYTSKGKDWGLDTYFAQHGPVESLFIAGGMLVGFELLYDLIFPTKEYLSLFMLGGIIDVAVRMTMPMESLKDYYEQNHPLYTIFWAGFPATWLKWKFT